MQLNNIDEELRLKILSLMKEESYKPLTVQEIQELLDLERADDFKELVKMLVQLEQSGHLIRSRTNRYGVPERMNHVRGKFIGHAKGFGFVVPETDGMDDVFIPPNEVNGAMNGDIVLVRVSSDISGDAEKEQLPESLNEKQQKLLECIKITKALDSLFLTIKNCQWIFL